MIIETLKINLLSGWLLALLDLNPTVDNYCGAMGKISKDENSFLHVCINDLSASVEFSAYFYPFTRDAEKLANRFICAFVFIYSSYC